MSFRKSSRDPGIAELRNKRGAALRHFRQLSKMRANDVVRALSVKTGGKMDFTTGAIYAWEHGRNFMPDELRNLFCDIFGVTIGDFDTFAESVPVSTAVAVARGLPELGWLLNVRGEEPLFEVVLSVRCGAKMIRNRTWSLCVDAGGRVVIRSNAGTDPNSIGLLRGVANNPSERLQTKPNPRNFNEAVIDAAEWQSLMNDARGATAQGAAEKVGLSCAITEPIFLEDLRALLGHPLAGAAAAPKECALEAPSAPEAGEVSLENVILGGGPPLEDEEPHTLVLRQRAVG